MAYNNMGISYGKLGKINEEIAALRKAVSLRPGYAIAHFNLSMAYLKQGRRENALNEYRAVKDLDEGLAATLKKELDRKRK